MHQSMLVFSSLKEFRLSEPDENRHKMRLERITNNSEAVIRTFKALRENTAALDAHTVQYSEEERESAAREVLMGKLCGEKKEEEEEEESAGELEREKENLEAELEFYNGQLSGITDETRQLIADVNSIQFYS